MQVFNALKTTVLFRQSTPVTTFVATLLLPLQAAVGLGAILSALIYLYQSSMDVVVVEQILRPDGAVEERRPDKQLESNKVTVLYVYGQLYYAGAATLDRLLPKPNGAESPELPRYCRRPFRLSHAASAGSSRPAW